MLDLESSGLSPQQDRLLAIAAVAVHTGSDKAFISPADSFEVVIRQPAANVRPVMRNPWLDLQPLAGVLRPDVKALSLDEWMQALGVTCALRHQAATDTWATAELLLKLWPARRTELPHPSFWSAMSLAEQRRWLVPW